jgi:hypothetical protein
MSLKSKNLEFDASQPAFLQRLRGQIQGSLPSDRDPDKHIEPSRFGKRKTRLGDEDGEDDGPVYVLESGESLSKAEYDAREAFESKAEGKEGVEGEKSLLKKEGKELDSGVKVGGVSKKRKALRVGGDEEGGEAKKESGKGGEKREPVKKKSKKKKVALSFGDDEEG